MASHVCKRESEHHVNDCRTRRSRLRCQRILTPPVESKPNSRMIKTNTIGIMLMTSSNHRQKIATATMPRRTPSNGLETANQKEKSQPESWRLDLSFMVLSKAFEDRHFTKTRNFLCNALAQYTACFSCRTSTGEPSGLQTRIAATESLTLCVPMRRPALSNWKRRFALAVVEILAKLRAHKTAVREVISGFQYGCN